MSGIIGRKLGMTQVFTDDGSVVPVTAIEAGPCHVTALRTQESNGYVAVQLAFGPVKESKLTKPRLGHLKKAGVAASQSLAEFREELELDIGDQVTVEVFEKGQRVKVTGRSKGKGFQGTIRRHNFSRGPASHGSHNIRAPGSVGASATPSRVFKGQRMPGHMGDVRVTQRGLEIFDVDAARNLLLLKGAVPGPRGGIVEVRSE